MKTQIVLFALLCGLASARIRLTGSTICVCSELTQQADCLALSILGCKWNTASSSCSASAATTVTCTYTTQSECDARSGCAWTNAGACSAFTACSDYTVTDSNQCYAKDSTCIPGTTSGTSTTCQTGTATCSSITDETTCSQVRLSSTSKCYWSTTCISQDYSKCSTITNEIFCYYQDCDWTNNACVAPTCAAQTETTCTYVNADTFPQVYICNWSNNACADAADTSALTSTNCMSNTMYTYKWNGSSCVACSGSSRNAFLLAFFALLAVLLF